MNRLAVCMTLLLLSGQAGGATIVSTLGNDASALTDGQLTTIVDLIAAHSGQSAPFDQGYGNDLLDDFSTSWTHDFGALTDPIVSVSITIGIAEHDSAFEGDQLALFGFDSVDLTADMNTLFESGGGLDTEYNIYTLALDAADFSDVSDGVASFNLVLSGPTESCGLFPPCLVTNFNGAHLIFSRLTIETRPIPGPASLWLFGGGLAMLGNRWRRKNTQFESPTASAPNSLEELQP